MTVAVEYHEIRDFPGYRVGDDGTVWRAWVTCRSGRKLTETWRPMKPRAGEKGYLTVNLTPPGGGRYRTFRVHRLVLEAFVGPCPAGMEGRHLDGVKSNCRRDNLAWGTPAQNREDNRRLGVYQSGESHSRAIVTGEIVRRMRGRYAAGEATIKALAAEHGLAYTTAYGIVTRRSWKHVA